MKISISSFLVFFLSFSLSIGFGFGFSLSTSNQLLAMDGQDVNTETSNINKNEVIVEKKPYLFVIDELAQTTLGFYPWDKKRMEDLASFFQAKKVKAILSYLPDSNKYFSKYFGDNLFNSQDNDDNNDRYHLSLDRSLAKDKGLKKLLNFLDLNITFSSRINSLFNAKEVKKISVLEIFKGNFKEDLSGQVIVLGLEGRDKVKKRGPNNTFYYHSDLVIYFLDQAF